MAQGTSWLAGIGFALAVVSVGIAQPAQALGGTLGAIAVFAGGEQTCILRADHHVHCWGYSTFDDSAGDATAVSVSGTNTCILRTSRNVSCYGDNTYGQSYYGGGDALAVSTGLWHICVLKASANVQCLGDKARPETADYTGGDATAVSTAGVSHTCVLKANRDVHCYGDNTYGESADYTGGDATAIATDSFYTCVLKATGNIHCYGSFSTDYMGGDATTLSSLGGHVCLTKATGAIHCYGDNSAGQSIDYQEGDATAVAAGGAHTCVLLANGSVQCYGNNSYAQAYWYGVPAPPLNLAATTATPNHVTLDWDYPAPDLDGQFFATTYTVYRGVSSGGEVPYMTVSSGGGHTTFPDDCPLLATCYYQVTATNSFGEGKRTAEVSGQPVVLPVAGVVSCAVYNSEHGDPYPGQDGVVVEFGDGSHSPVCVAPATPPRCPAAGLVLNNEAICVPPTCGTAWGPGWMLGAAGHCVAAPWVAVYPLYPGCPPAATVGVVVYGQAGNAVLTFCF